jgi:hypothetical protein
MWRPPHHRPARVRVPVALLAGLCALAITGCGNTLQDVPIGHNTLEGMVMTPFPVYWLGASFHGLAISEVTHDPSGGFAIQYGNCLQGGQSTCVTPLQIVTSPNNGFVPGGSAPGRVIPVRAVYARFAAKGRTIVIPTGPVVVDIYASDARVAREAAQSAVPISEPQYPGSELPASLPDTGFDQKPLPDQMPPPMQVLHPPRAVVKVSPGQRARRKQGARRSSSG